MSQKSQNLMYIFYSLQTSRATIKNDATRRASRARENPIRQNSCAKREKSRDATAIALKTGERLSLVQFRGGREKVLFGKWQGSVQWPRRFPQQERRSTL